MNASQKDFETKKDELVRVAARVAAAQRELDEANAEFNKLFASLTSVSLKGEKAKSPAASVKASSQDWSSFKPKTLQGRVLLALASVSPKALTNEEIIATEGEKPDTDGGKRVYNAMMGLRHRGDEVLIESAVRGSWYVPAEMLEIARTRLLEM